MTAEQVLRIVVTISVLMTALGICWQAVRCFIHWPPSKFREWQWSVGSDGLEPVEVVCRLLANLLWLLYAGGMSTKISWIDDPRMPIVLGGSLIVIACCVMVVVMIAVPRPRRSLKMRVFLMLSLLCAFLSVLMLGPGVEWLQSHLPSKWFPVVSLPFLATGQIRQILTTRRDGVGRQSLTAVAVNTADWTLWIVYSALQAEWPLFGTAVIMTVVFWLRTGILAWYVHRQKV